ncbi:hypothetical protein BLNAU_12574 [Blattamonas nauphoetae]|uniref:Uncharacterized protein n=1 Tax=Blattamonas nauphoetae TaxID=2049346 RepID=A0ABQ9XJ59_9EUKA|nr:hypothetical protein BLNAU_12574 [Blattamonas nauphoetae]
MIQPNNPLFTSSPELIAQHEVCCSDKALDGSEGNTVGIKKKLGFEKGVDTGREVAESQTENTLSLSLYPHQEADLVYGHNYSVTSMEAEPEEPILMEASDCSFETPSEPPRLASVVVGEMVSDSDESTVTLSFVSFALERTTEYTIQLTSAATPLLPMHTSTHTLWTQADGSLLAFAIGFGSVTKEMITISTYLIFRDSL